MRDYKQDVYDIKDTSNVLEIPIEEFEDLTDLIQFVQAMQVNNIGVVMRADEDGVNNEVFVDIYDKDACDGKMKRALLS